MRILAFTVSRADTPKRGQMLLNTITQARATAGCEFDWHLYCQLDTIAERVGLSALTTGMIQELKAHPDNRGQHPPFNETLQAAQEGGYDFLLRLDDDGDFLTKRWLVKLLEVSAAFEHTAILTPAVKGLKHPPPRLSEVEVGGHKVELLTAAIGGLCRLHPVKVLVDKGYHSDVRLPLGSGDASGMGDWAMRQRDPIVPMVWCKNIRVRHTTREQEREDKEHFLLHNLFQRIPYVPAIKETM